MAKRYDRHHIFWERKKWRSGTLKDLRKHKYCIVQIPREMHEIIHRRVGYVPLPSGRSARIALRRIKSLEESGEINRSDAIETRLYVLLNIFETIEPEVASALKQQLSIVYEWRYPLV